MSKYPVDKRFGTIYKIENKINHKVYIGQTIMDVKDRWYRHCEINKSNPNEGNMLIKKAILKYGKDNFEVSIIEKVPKEKLNEREMYWISYYNSNHDGYNIESGGIGGSKPPKLNKAEILELTNKYLSGYSCRKLSLEYKVDKATIANYLKIQGIEIQDRRPRKFSESDIQEIRELSKKKSRNELIQKFNISHSYLSQILNGKYRI